jgi:hypothetical protein
MKQNAARNETILNNNNKYVAGNLDSPEGEHTPTSRERRKDCTKSRVFPDLVADGYGTQEMPAFAGISK